MSVVGSNALAGASGQAGAAGYEIERSLRFDSGSSSYLSRTPSSAGNRKTWTWSGWVKRSSLGTEDGIFVCSNSAETEYVTLYFNSANELATTATAGVSTDWSLKTNRVFRDVSAWMHIVLVVDTTQATNSNRVKLYVNGVQETSFRQEVYPSQNFEGRLNSAQPHAIGSAMPYNAWYSDFYLADVHFIDGQALAATDFGEYDDNNVWQPKEFTGSYDQSAGGRTIANSSGAVPLLNTSDDDGQTVSSGVRTDSNASSIVLALPLNGSNGGTTITDYHHTIKGSGSAKAITLFSGASSGGAVTSTAVSKYYGSSFYVVRGGVNANQSDYITRTGDSDLNLGTGDFCVEFWFHPTSLDTNYVMFDNRHPTTGWPTSSNGFAIVGNGSGDIFLYHGGYQRINHSAKLTVNTWHHIAVTRDSGTERLFVDGDFFSSTYSSSNNYNESRFLLGSSAPNGEGSTGYFQDLRIYVGAAKYTSNFNVPALGVGGVNSFYLKFDDNSSNAALGTDSSGLSNTWTVNNLSVAGGPLSSSRGTNYDDDSAAYTEYGTVSQATGQTLPMSNPSHYEGAAMRVNSGGFKVVTTNSATTDFFMACWVKLDSLVNGHQIGVDLQGSYKYFEVRGDGSVLVRHTGGGASQSSTGTLSSNTWTHIALSRSGSTLRAFVNGTIVCSTTAGVTGDSISANEEFNFFGQSGTLYNTTGYLLDPVVYIGAGRSTNYTTPTAPLLTSAGAINDVAGMSSSNRYYASPLISVGAGEEAIDSLIDTPTNYEAASGNNGGNYATWNPLQKYAAITLSNGNLDFTDSNSNNGGDQGVHATIAPVSGKFYWEMTLSTLASENYIGISKSDKLTQTLWTGGGVDGYYYYNNGNKIGGGNGNGGQSYGASFGAGDVIGVAVDWDNGKVTFYKNGTSQGDAFTGKDLTGYIPAYYFNTMQSSAGVVNFGQRPFAYTPPTGYKSLCTQNLANPTIADGSTAFDIATYGGNSSSQVINTSFSADLIWTKARNDTYRNVLVDTIRGGSAVLHSDRGDLAENTTTVVVSSFGNTSYTLGGTSNATNQTGKNYVAWYWDAGSSTASNTDGTITSQVRANPSAGFSIATISSATGSSTASLGHGLNAQPHLVIQKSRTNTFGWHIYAKVNGTYKFLQFSTAAASSTNTQNMGITPTSSVVGLGSNFSGSNDYVYYCISPVAGYSAVGSYIANGSATDGPFVFTGMRPKFILAKISSGNTDDWVIYDTERSPFNAADDELYPNSGSAEVSGSRPVDILSNGFKIRNNSNKWNGASGYEYFYAAFAEHPLRTARAR